jgi:ADP-heptose:LPS heptosyltransferase
MPQLFRSISLLLRRRQSGKAVTRILRSFDHWKTEQEDLPAYPVQETSAASRKKTLVIRLDDIGDWLLFRNHFAVYKNSFRWPGHELVLLGNAVWKDLFAALDSETADRAIWVDKGEYARNAAYRLDLWTRLRQKGFATVVCPSRTRPLLLDDLCVLATGAPQRLASVNTFPDRAWNELSDGLYTELFRGGDPLLHEFFFNGSFAEWCCGKHFEGSRPEIDGGRIGEGGAENKVGDLAGAGGMPPYILCFIGSSTKSKRWPVQNWIGLIRILAQKQAPGGKDLYKIIIAGGPQDMAMADSIQKATGAHSIAGKASLPEMIGWAGGAAALVTNDTMAAHLGPSCNRPTLIIANGNNSLRFTDYARAGIGNVVTIYPRVFLRKRKKRAEDHFHHVAVSADIASIGAETVAGELETLIRKASR